MLAAGLQIHIGSGFNLDFRRLRFPGVEDRQTVEDETVGGDIDGEDRDTDDDFDVPPYEPGDSVRVEIHSITEEAFNFLSIAKEQMTNGDNTIFALPLANTKSNVFHSASGERALGFFNVAKVSTGGRTIE